MRLGNYFCKIPYLSVDQLGGAMETWFFSILDYNKISNVSSATKANSRSHNCMNNFCLKLKFIPFKIKTNKSWTG